ncbi:fibritin neck whiskers protein [Acinetobacter phage vB_AbaM_PhT2]|uniref:Fibritin neck whiskers protein n=1 Tax=Acinetobacter phage vB_AbaM_PhT2 TaxID=2690230 RepID=A0A6B9SZ93_9CAUD|nr:fibritin neck whisker [Acinetobacter phage vB_AbaM_PhT2]QHJ75775.1 fibritin neck whiskers protein [Acinetobacter phage vB_AbaM_PhT2]
MNSINKLPFVDGIPQEGQSRLSWIKDGELLEGAKTHFGSEGNLNKVNKELQENIAVICGLIDNIGTLYNLHAEDIEKIKAILADAGNADLITQVNKNSDDIKTVNTAVGTLNNEVQETDRNLITLVDLVGSPDLLQDGRMTAFENLHFIKAVIGNEAEFDVNGNSAPNNPESGLISRISAVLAQAIQNRDKIQQIEETIDSANFDELETKVLNIRAELGSTPGSTSVYGRLDRIESNEVDTDARLDKIELSIGGPDKIIDAVDKNARDILAIDNHISGANGVDSKIETLNTAVFVQGTGIADRVDTIDLKVANLDKTINDPDTGLVQANNTLRDAIGIDSADSTSVLGRLNTLEDNTANTATAVQDLQLAVGNTTTGLVADSSKYSKSLYGDSTAVDPVDKAGVVNTTKSVYTGLNDANTAIKGLYDRMKYNGLKYSSLSDAAVDANDITISSMLNMTLAKSVKSPDGIVSISQQNDFADAIKSDVVLVNIGTWDYAFNTPLGTKADASTEYSGSVSFYNEVFKLFDKILTATSKTRVFVTNGYRSTLFTDGVQYPEANTEAHTLDDYSTAISEVAKMFGIPVIDTNNEFGLYHKNSALFLTASGFTNAGSQRFVNLVVGQINSK